MTNPEKNFDTGLRIIEVLKILFERELSKNELIEELKLHSNFENVYTPEAFIKYFNTLELMGFEIAKNKNVYQLKNALSEMKLSDDELNVFTEIVCNIKKLHNKPIENSFKDITYKVLKYLDKESQLKLTKALNNISDNVNENNNIINYFENLLYEKQLITITYNKNKVVQDTITVKLKEIIEKNGDIIIVCYDPVKARNKKLHVSDIAAVKQTPKKASDNSHLNSVVFRVYGRLATLYKIKEYEKVLDFGSGYLTISNYGEDKDALLKRLLKYGENCKIIRPQSIKDDFLRLTDDILNNLQEGAL